MKRIEDQNELILKLKEKVYYDETSKSCLRFTSNSIKPYREAGNIDTDSRQRLYKRWRVRMDSVNYLAHRVVWLLHYGPIPYGFEIDHIDGDALNNKLCNLRLLEKAKNRRNSSIRKDNTSGHTGTSIESEGCRAFVKVNKKDVTRYFSFSKYGKEKALELALRWRQEMIEKLNTEGAGYTSRHGK